MRAHFRPRENSLLFAENPDREISPNRPGILRWGKPKIRNPSKGAAPGKDDLLFSNG